MPRFAPGSVKFSRNFECECHSVCLVEYLSKYNYSIPRAIYGMVLMATVSRTVRGFR